MTSTTNGDTNDDAHAATNGDPAGGTSGRRRGPLAQARRAHILAALARDGQVRAAQLIDELGVAAVTLRRDLGRLEREGLLVRVHGGAMPALTPSAAESVRSETAAGGAIAVLVPSLNYYWPGVVAGMEAAAERFGMGIVLRGASYELQDERPALERLARADGVRGLIVAPNTDTAHAADVVRWLGACDVPSVLVEREAVALPGHEPLESVNSDHALGAVLAARHLASLGHRRIVLARSRRSPTSRKIAVGWHAAGAELGITSTPGPEAAVLPDRRSPEFSAAVDAMLDAALDAGTTAMLVHSDPEAMAVIDLAINRGIAVPDELSVVSYDDEVAEHFSPALTAVSPPRQSVGATAVDLLLKRIADPARPVSRVLISPALIERESTAPAPR